MTREAETLIRINVHYARRKGFVFTEDGQSYLFELHIDDTMRNLRATPEAHGFTLGTLANTSENLLRLALGHLTDRRFCLYGPTEFPIVADSASGVES
ncbi:hypothetical protein [Pseudomonas putida]|uniref:hypothetical protein n=1 Tax=Pseudomonas putida TaxID=303 RepID=UPI0011981EDC|nr:hypothetical protein [Pseudomonas putida]